MSRFFSFLALQKFCRQIFFRLRRNFPRCIYLCSCVFLLTLSLSLYRLFHTIEVTINAGGEVYRVASKAEKVADLLAEQGMALGAHDRVSPGLEETLEEEMQVSIQRATPVIMTTDTGSFRHYTHASTVFGAFKELGIPLTGGFVVEPELDTALSCGQEIFLFRREEVVETFQEKIPWPVEKRDDSRLLTGRQNVLQEGQEGIKELRFRVVYAGGKELLRKLINETVLQQPVPLIVAVGTKAKVSSPPRVVMASRGNGIEGLASWYGSEFHGRRTSSGEVYNQNEYTAAHCYLPFGTIVQVTYLRTGKSVTVRINDRGPYSASRVIDLSSAAAEAIGLKSHGVGQVRVEILEKP